MCLTCVTQQNNGELTVRASSSSRIDNLRIYGFVDWNKGNIQVNVMYILMKFHDGAVSAN